jgi:hypothetical protein
MSNWCCRGVARDRQYDNFPSYCQIRLQLNIHEMKKRLVCHISVWWFLRIPYMKASSDWTIDWLESSSWMLSSKKLRTSSSFTSSSSAIVFLLLLPAIEFRPQVQLLWSSLACRWLVQQDPETVDALVYHVLWYNVLKRMCILNIVLI